MDTHRKATSGIARPEHGGRAWSGEFECSVRRALEEDAPASLIHVDVAGAWDVRDAGGPDAGEALCEAIEAWIDAVAGDGERVRSGPCEYTLLLERTHPARALEEARALKRAIDRHRFRWHGHSFPLQAYAGVVGLAAFPQEPHAWLLRAREACAAARDLHGRGVQAVGSGDHDWSDVERDRDWVRHVCEIIG